jgi:hypothetical protein
MQIIAVKNPWNRPVLVPSEVFHTPVNVPRVDRRPWFSVPQRDPELLLFELDQVPWNVPSGQSGITAVVDAENPVVQELSNIALHMTIVTMTFFMMRIPPYISS